MNSLPCDHSPVESGLSDDEDSEDDDNDEDEQPRRKFAFPELDTKIREAVKQYGAVFPKLNFSSPRVRPLLFMFESVTLICL